MSFDDISAGLASGQFVRFEVIPSTMTLSGIGNTRIRLFREDGTSLEATVKYDPEDNLINPPVTKVEPMDYPETSGLHMLPIDRESLDDWRIIKFSRKEVSPPSRGDLLLTASYQWSAGKSFLDLQTLTLMFLQGLIPATPYHFGPLDPESNLILHQLHLINRLDMITVNSQPYDVFPSYQDEKIMIHQYVFVIFYYPRVKAAQLDELFRKYITSAIITKYDFQTGEETVITQVDPKYLIQEMVPNAIYYQGSTIVELVPAIPGTPFGEIGPNELGPNFISLVQQELVGYYLSDARPSNEIFDDLAGLAKQLI